MDMKHVTGEQLQRVLNPVLDQCDEVLRRIPCLRLPPMYPPLLKLTDARGRVYKNLVLSTELIM